MITPFRLRHITAYVAPQILMLFACTASVAPQILMLFANLLLSSKQCLTECIEERHTMILIDSRRPTVGMAHSQGSAIPSKKHSVAPVTCTMVDDSLAPEQKRLVVSVVYPHHDSAVQHAIGAPSIY